MRNLEILLPIVIFKNTFLFVVQQYYITLYSIIIPKQTKKFNQLNFDILATYSCKILLYKGSLSKKYKFYANFNLQRVAKKKNLPYKTDSSDFYISSIILFTAETRAEIDALIISVWIPEPQAVFPSCSIPT